MRLAFAEELQPWARFVITPADYLSAHTGDLVRLLQAFIRVPTVNPPGDRYDEMTRLLAEEMEASGLAVQRLAIPKALARRTLAYDPAVHPRFNLLGRWGTSRRRRTLHFNAHYDVVPVSPGWRHSDAFSGTVERGWIYGRGAADMKGSIAALLLALRALRACGRPPALNIEVSFTADEETDSLLGASWLVQHAPIRPDYVVVMEGGERDAVCCGHNGVVWLEVTVHGRAAHGSKPEHGINALEKMAALIRAFDDYKQQLKTRSFTTPEGKVMLPSVNLGGVFSQGAGGKVNTVPALAHFTIDRRVLAVETVAGAERELRQFLVQTARSIPQCRISIARLAENDPCFSEPRHPFFAAMARCVTRVRRRPAVFNVSTGFNDMHFFSHHFQVPTLGYGPGGVAYHAIDERARIADLLNCARIYAELMSEFAG